MLVPPCGQPNPPTIWSSYWIYKIVESLMVMRNQLCYTHMVLMWPTRSHTFCSQRCTVVVAVWCWRCNVGDTVWLYSCFDVLNHVVNNKLLSLHNNHSNSYTCNTQLTATIMTATYYWGRRNRAALFVHGPFLSNNNNHKTTIIQTKKRNSNIVYYQTMSTTRTITTRTRNKDTNKLPGQV